MLLRPQAATKVESCPCLNRISSEKKSDEITTWRMQRFRLFLHPLPLGHHGPPTVRYEPQDLGRRSDSTRTKDPAQQFAGRATRPCNSIPRRSFVLAPSPWQFDLSSLSNQRIRLKTVRILATLEPGPLVRRWLWRPAVHTCSIPIGEPFGSTRRSRMALPHQPASKLPTGQTVVPCNRK